MYDPEAMGGDPELRSSAHPIAAIEAFAVDGRGAPAIGSIVTPHPNLVEVPGRSARGASESVDAASSGAGITAAAARVAATSSRCRRSTSSRIRRRTRVWSVAAADQARAANPTVLVISGLSTRFAADGPGARGRVGPP